MSKRFSTNMISTVTNQGKVQFMIYSENMNSQKFIDFLKQLTKNNEQKIFLIIDNLRFHHSYIVQDWIKENKQKIELFFLPAYSPEKNPDEYLNCDLKQGLSSKPAPKNQEKLRRIKYYDQETNKIFIFLTNNFKLTALQIALLYKQRWQIELFFKWIKQHLKIKTFWGTSESAVRIQVNIAIIKYCLVSIISKDLKIDRTNREILQILSVSLIDKTPVNELLMKSDYNNVKEQITNQLVFNLF